MALLLVVRAAAWAALAGGQPVPEELGITWRCARHLATGAGLAFEPGAPWEPLLTATSPGLALLVAPLARVGLAPHVAAPLLALAVEALALGWLLRRLGRAGRGSLALAVAGLWIAHPGLARDVGVGGEGVLLLGLSWALVARVGAGSALWALPLAAAAMLVRAEAFFLLPVAVLALPTPGRLRTVALGVALLGVAVGLGAWGLETVGAALPEALRARQALADGAAVDPLAPLRMLAADGVAGAVVLGLAVVGAGVLLRRGWAALRAEVAAERARAVRTASGEEDATTRSEPGGANPAPVRGPGLPLLAAACPAIGLALTRAPADDPLGYGLRVATVLLAAAALEPLLARVAAGARASGHPGVPPATGGPRRGVVAAVLLGAALLAGVAAVLEHPAAARRRARVEALRAWAEDSGWAAGVGDLLGSHPGLLGYWGGGHVLDASGRATGTLWLSPAAGALVDHWRPEWVLLDLDRASVARWRADDRRARDWFPVRTFGVPEGVDLRFPELDELPERRDDAWLLLRRRL